MSPRVAPEARIVYVDHDPLVRPMPGALDQTRQEGATTSCGRHDRPRQGHVADAGSCWTSPSCRADLHGGPRHNRRVLLREVDLTALDGPALQASYLSQQHSIDTSEALE